MKEIRKYLISIIILEQIIFFQTKVYSTVQKSSLNQRSPYSTFAQTDTQAIADELVNRYLNKIPIQTTPINLTFKQALEVQNKFVQLLIPSLGRIVGYKAGLTNQATQKRFNISHPIQGVLLEKMLLKTGAVVSAEFGTRPGLEGDLIVRVASEKINTATTTQEALSTLDAIIPFIELPDLVYAENVKLNASQLVAVNVGARLGIIGEPITLTATQEWQERLKKIRVVICDRAGNQLAVGESKALLGDPLKVVLWLRNFLQTQGKSLKKGDLLSLGTITPAIPVKSGTTIRAQYLGLEPNNLVEISVKFEE